MKIKLVWENGTLSGTLDDSQTARFVADALPVSSRASTWGKEVYFTVPVDDTLAPDATDVVEPGTICFWTEGSSIAIPFGPTPASRGDECRLVTRVNVIGKLDGDLAILDSVQAGGTIRVERG
jgi:hypothetical protein